MKRINFGMTFLVLATTIAAGTGLQMSSFQTALIPLEGGPRGFRGVNPRTNALGAFQLTPIALRDIGYKDAAGNWTAKARALGVSTDEDFLGAPQTQIKIDNEYNQRNVQLLGSTYQQRMGTTDSYSGATLTPASMAYCSEALGAGGCRTYLATGTISQRNLDQNPLWRAGGFGRNMVALQNTSLTDSGNVDVDTTTTTQTNPDGSGSTTTTTSVEGVFCDPAIMKQITDGGRQMVDNWTALASRPETGYTLLGGQSVMEAAGLIKQGQPGYVGQGSMFSSLAQSGSGTPFGGATFAMASCLDKFTKSGVDIVFSGEGINDILDALEKVACNAANKLFAEVTAPLSQSVFKAFSMNGLIPGLNLGSLGAGVSIGVQPGGRANGGGLVNISNGNSDETLSYTPDAGWYQGNSGFRGGGPGGGGTSSYGSLFGR